jgi:glycosyltransferase involved in cell wall biosynthesis
MQSTYDDRKIIAHFVGLSGIGGVQSNFVAYMKNIKLHPSKYQHKVYTVGNIDLQYQFSNNILNIKKISNLYKLILDLISRDVIVHFYNNLSSFKVALLLAFLPVHQLIIHERGTIWNQKYNRRIISSFVAWKASVILSNSVATKIMLVNKLSISEKKIRVLHNGIDTSINYNYHSNYKKNNSVFYIGFIGRLDLHKGAHILIDAMNYLVHKNIKLVIAGDGVLKKILKTRASKLNNVEFIGRVNNPYSFITTINLLVVPSIREPLGNVCLEAGLCKVPVLAANIDGLPEIIKHRVTGELINPTDVISVDFPEVPVLLPEFVVNPNTQKLQIPKQINPCFLAKRILELSTRPERLNYYADNLHDEVANYFNINRYSTELHKIYDKIDCLD